MHGDDITPMESLRTEVAIIQVDLRNIKSDIDFRHTQNRVDIEQIKNSLKSIMERLTKVEVKIALYAAIAGSVAGLILKAIEIFVRK